MKLMSRPFLVAPILDEEGVHSWYDDPELTEMLHSSGSTPGAMLEGVLSALDCGKPDNGIELGYMLTVSVYDLFSRNGDWVFNAAKFQRAIDFMSDSRRPAVVNLRANHFVGESKLAQELSADDTSLARTNDGSVIRETYFDNTTFAPVFSLDSSIRLNRFRFGGFREAMRMLARFDRENPGILRAVTIAGELHHYISNLQDPNSAGRFGGIQITDYSDASIRDFAAWLGRRCESIQEVNRRFETPFASWKEVDPPRFDLSRQPDQPLWMHMDSYAAGSAPIYGWADVEVGGRIAIFVDGQHLGDARHRLSRMDVYAALPQLANGDVGFRYELDYVHLRPGRHQIHLVIQRANGDQLLLDRRAVQIGTAESADHGMYPGLDTLPRASDVGIAGCVDHPADGLVLRYNPFAAEWQRFREFQVSSLLAAFTRIAVDSGLDANKTYAHQIPTHLEGSWNYGAFAVRAGDLAETACRPGLSLYGSAVTSPHLPSLTGGRPYGVPEFHPRMGKGQSREIFRHALEFHRTNGATFLCPYFMSIGRKELGPRNSVRDMQIHPLNPVLGGSYFYDALRDFLRQP